MTTSINGNPVINTLKSGKSTNDTILYAIEVKGNTTDTLKVNLKVKWNGGQETVLLEEQRSFLLSDLVKEKYTIQLPVAFSDLIFYNSLKKSIYKEQNTYDRINTIKDKDELLYHKMMDEYQKKIEKTIDEKKEKNDEKNIKKGNETDALNDINNNQFNDVDNYEWNKDNVNKNRAKKWKKFSKEKREEYKGRITKWKILDTIK